MRYRKAALIAAPLVIAAAVAGAVTAGQAGVEAAPTSFAATLSSYNEVPANSTKATGTLTVTLTDAPSLDYTLSYSNASATVAAAHIHFAQEDVSGGIAAFLCGGGDKPACPATDGQVSGSIDPADVIGPSGQGIAAGEFSELVKAMRKSKTYANVHTSTFTMGEFRGQIRPTP
jgi:hypothetical protein